MLISQRGVIFFTDTYVTVNPTAEEIAEMTVLAAEEIRRFGIEPKAALLSHSNFGSRDSRKRAEDARGARRSCSASRPSWRATARCRATRRCRKCCASASIRIRR